LLMNSFAARSVLKTEFSILLPPKIIYVILA
jgi:hypothetical protein